MDRSDQALIIDYLAGDKLAFDILAGRYLKLVWAVAVRYAKDEQDAEDITQDVFIKLLRHLKSFDLRKPFKPWLMRIARNQTLDHLKRRRDIPATALVTEAETDPLEDLASAAPAADEVLSRAESIDRLRRAMSRFPADVQLIFHLRYFQELTFDEIAQRIGSLLNTVKSKHRRALLGLRKSLDDV